MTDLNINAITFNTVVIITASFLSCCDSLKMVSSTLLLVPGLQEGSCSTFSIRDDCDSVAPQTSLISVPANYQYFSQDQPERKTNTFCHRDENALSLPVTL